jgi:hypothetical protein
MCLSACAGGGQSMSRSLSEREREKLAGEIARLQSLDIEQLRARWRVLYGTEGPIRFSRDLLIHAVNRQKRLGSDGKQETEALSSLI